METTAHIRLCEQIIQNSRDLFNFLTCQVFNCPKLSVSEWSAIQMSSELWTELAKPWLGYRLIIRGSQQWRSNHVIISIKSPVREDS